jgi:hypothetical protein
MIEKSSLYRNERRFRLGADELSLIREALHRDEETPDRLLTALRELQTGRIKAITIET